MKKTTNWRNQRKKELRKWIKEITVERRVLRDEQRGYKLELYKLKEGEGK